MRMFEALNATVDILKANVSADITIFDYEPGDGHPDFDKMPAVYVYFSDTDFVKSAGAEAGEQQHDPRYYADVYVSEKATQSQATTEIVFSTKNAHDTARLVLHEIYYIIMDQSFRFEIEKIIGNTGGHYLERIEKLGVVKFPESKKSIVAYRATFKISIAENPEGYSGIPFDQTVDAITASREN